MTVNIDWEGFDDGDQPDPDAQPTSGKGLRAQVEKMAARLKSVEAENVTLKAERSRGQVEKAVETLGYAPEVAEFYPSDQPATPDAVAAWLEKRSAVFSKLKAEPAASAEGDEKEPEETPSEEVVTTATPSAQAIWKLLQEAEIAPPDNAQSVLAKLAAAESEEDVMAIIDSGGQ